MMKPQRSLIAQFLRRSTQAMLSLNAGLRNVVPSIDGGALDRDRYCTIRFTLSSHSDSKRHNCIRRIVITHTRTDYCAMAAKPLGPAPQNITDVIAQQKSIVLPHFTADDAYELGTSIRTRLRRLFPDTPAVVNIALTNSDNLLYHACTCPGVLPDNDTWIARKRNTVKRWGIPSWQMRLKMSESEEAFKNKYMLGEAAGQYAIHGGGVPIRVRNVEGILAIIVVSGLKQDQDHQAATEGLEEFIKQATSNESNIAFRISEVDDH